MTVLADRPLTAVPAPMRPKPKPPSGRSLPPPAPAATARSTLAFRAVLTARGHDCLDAVRSGTAAWITGKYRSCPAASGHHALTDTVTLTNQAVYGAGGRESAIRLQLREQRPEATWRTTVTAIEAGPHLQAAVSLEVFPTRSHHPTPAWPALIRALTKAMRPLDGPAHLTCAAQSIGVYDVPFLLDILTSPERRLPAIVAARPLHPDPVWSERIGKIKHGCAGAASLYLLEDAAAVDAFREAAGFHYRANPGTVRTYLPRLEIVGPADALRHRYIPGARICDPADTAYRSIAACVQRSATVSPLPPALQAVRFPEIGAVHREARHAALHALRPALELEAARKDLEEVKELLVIADGDLREADARAELDAATIANLEAQVNEAMELAESRDEEALWALAEAERARVEAEILRARLLAEDRYEDAAVEVDAVTVPLSFRDVFERAGSLKRIVLTADRDTAVSLDEYERSDLWAAKAWQALRALDAYAAATDFNGTFYDYCKQGVTGSAGWSANLVTMRESEPTMTSWGHERIFPVPLEVDESGLAVMQAHVKLKGRGTIYPRVYFLDDKKGPTGRVIVGYVGPHLTNTKTN